MDGTPDRDSKSLALISCMTGHFLLPATCKTQATPPHVGQWRLTFPYRFHSVYFFSPRCSCPQQPRRISQGFRWGINWILSALCKHIVSMAAFYFERDATEAPQGPRQGETPPSPSCASNDDNPLTSTALERLMVKTQQSCT